MKVSLNWVKEYTKIVLSPEELRERVSVSLTEVESLENFGDRFENMVVAEVKSVEPHPESESLLVLTVDIGSKKVQTIVQKCPVKVGDLVPYLPPGTRIPGEIGSDVSTETVTAVEIKGVASEGMVPSGKELGLNHDHTTVYTIEEKSKVGTPFNQVLEIEDQILEIKNKALTHRPDAFSVEGVAREIAAIQGTKYRPLSWLHDWESLKPKDVEDRYPIMIVNDAAALCPRYMAVVLDDVNVKPSPAWMQVRLAKHGIRPVNNIVDISNYLMLEVGQPSHAFDYDKIIEKDSKFDGTAQITVRTAQGGERITTLDGQSKDLYDDTIVIADSSNPIGVAGVMGGKETEITDDTKRVIFQVENLDMFNVRRTSMKLGIASDAVTRFSKGLDPARIEPVLYKGMELMQKYSGAKVASKVQDDYQQPVRSHSVTFSPDLSRNRIGADISDAEMLEILQRLDLNPVMDKRNKTVTVSVPTVRRDISIPQDLDEEIVRIYGYDRIAPTNPLRKVRPIPVNNDREIRMDIKRVLSRDGANEMYTYSFVGMDLYEKCGLSLSGAEKIRNPLSPELEYMRPILLPSLLEKVPQNLVDREKVVGFEVDMVSPIDADKGKDGLPVEPWNVSLVHTSGYYHAKSYLENLINSLNISDLSIVPPGKTSAESTANWVQYALEAYHPSRVAYIRVGSDIVGVVGEIRPETRIEMKIDEPVSAFEINFNDLEPHISDVPTYRDPSRFPSVVHDFSILLDSDVPYAALVSAVRSIDDEEDIIQEVECVDIYQKKSGDDTKKITIRVTMQSYEKTLEEAEVEQVRKDIMEAVEKSVDGQLAK